MLSFCNLLTLRVETHFVTALLQQRDFARDSRIRLQVGV